jgi:transcriptional regulator with PAS, ATPase and Fis domain
MEHPARENQFHAELLVGESESFLCETNKIPLLAQSDATILISGETGTGKELFARAVHQESPRKAKAFIPVNCGALPDPLLENELFGHAKGAYTDASSKETGVITEAEGGTLFLDEVDTLPPAAQIKLLRFLQDHEYRPLGSSKSQVAHTRIITATNANLEKRVSEGAFREDLYYRLNTLSITMPPLRKRIGDIELLSNHFIAKYEKQYGRVKGIRLSPSAFQKILVYAWPGNVRQLESILQRAVILCALPLLQPEEIHLSNNNQKEQSVIGTLKEAKTNVLIQFEQTYLNNLLSKHHGNITHAAEEAGVKRQALQRLLKKHALQKSGYNRRSPKTAPFPSDKE